MIKAVSFDLWDTVIHDNSDEPKRRALGLRSKHDERRHLVWEALNRCEPTAYETVALAYDVTEAAFNHVWHDQHITWTVRERLQVLLNGLRRSLPEKDFEAVVNGHEEMEITVVPDVIPGMEQALSALAQRYKLCVVSDAVVTPGRYLRKWLEMNALKQYFTSFAFSDEVGRSKPHPEAFASAARQLGIELTEMVHVGDRDHNDIKGAQSLGMKAVLFTVTRDGDKDMTSADAICERPQDLPNIIERLAQKNT